MTLQERHDDAMYDFSRGDYAAAITKLRAILAEDPAHFDSQLALGMALYRQGEDSLEACCDLLAAHRDRLNGQIAAIQGELAKLEGKLRTFRARAATRRVPELAAVAGDA